MGCTRWSAEVPSDPNRSVTLCDLYPASSEYGLGSCYSHRVLGGLWNSPQPNFGVGAVGSSLYSQGDKDKNYRDGIHFGNVWQKQALKSNISANTEKLLPNKKHGTFWNLLQARTQILLLSQLHQMQRQLHSVCCVRNKNAMSAAYQYYTSYVSWFPLNFLLEQKVVFSVVLKTGIFEE